MKDYVEVSEFHGETAYCPDQDPPVLMPGVVADMILDRDPGVKLYKLAYLMETEGKHYYRVVGEYAKSDPSELPAP